MTVSMIKPVSLVKRPRVMLPAAREGAVSLVRPVRFTKRNPVVRRTRLYLSSRVLSFVDVVQRRDGTVWYAARRRPDAYPWGSRVIWTRTYRDFGVSLKERVDSERRAGCFRYATMHDRMS